MRFSRCLALIALAAVAATATDSLAQYDIRSPWPEEARGRGLPRPQWLLVVPAHREADGTLTMWDRRDEWTAAWLVPETRDGLRMVTLRGDTEDARTLDAKAIDEMQIGPMERVMRKYGAPAIALAVLDGKRVEVAIYVPGYRASWLPAPEAASPMASREAALDTLAFMTGDGRTGTGTAAASSNARSFSVSIEAWRPSETAAGGTDVLVVVDDPLVVEALGSMEGVLASRTIEDDATGTRMEMTLSGSVEGFEATLTAMGIAVR